MDNVYQREFQLPYEKREVLTWITKHHEHNAQQLLPQDVAWVNEILLGGEPAKLPHLVDYNLTPSVWFDVMLTKTSFTEEQIFEWIETNYDMLAFTKWTKWVAETAGNFIREQGEAWPEVFLGWASDLEEHYLHRDAKKWGGDIPAILIKNSPTRKLVFGLKDPDTTRLPGMYAPTKQVDKEFVTELQSEAYCA